MGSIRRPCLRQCGDKPVEGQADGSGRGRIKGLRVTRKLRSQGWDLSQLNVGAENQMSASELGLFALNCPYRQWREIAK